MTSDSRENPPLSSVVLRALALLPPRLRLRWWALVPLLLVQAAVESAAAASVYLVLARPGGSVPSPLGGVSPPLLLATLLLLKNLLVAPCLFAPPCAC